MRRLLAFALAASSLLAACSGADSPGEPAAPPPDPRDPARYLGKAVVASTSSPAEGVTSYTFDVASGPVCLRGDPFTASVRDSGSDDLFLFLQGGGACWSDFCLAIQKAPAGIPKLDILDPDRPTNPLRDTSLVYVPYCDGSLFSGDADHDDDGDGAIDRHQHGLANLTAALDVARSRFAHPKRVVLAGSSGGGYGTILATLLVRKVWPDVDLYVFDDSGPGLGRAGDPSYIRKIVDELAIAPMIPEGCADCTGDGHVTRLVGWELDHDPKLRVSVFSSYDDYVISDIFLQLAPGAYRDALTAQTGALHAAHPDRYRRFLVNGAVHTALLGGVDGLVGSDLSAVTLPKGFGQKLAHIELGGIDTVKIGDVSVASWFGAMLEGSETWADTTE